MINQYIGFLQYLKNNGYTIDYVEKQYKGWAEIGEEKDYYKLSLNYMKEQELE